jgi:hypothetical protein
MFTQLSKLAMFVMVVAANPGCDLSVPGAAPKHDITGKWSCVDGPITTSYDYRADGTCTKSVHLASNFHIKNATPMDPIHGTWHMNDDLSIDVKLTDYDESHELRVNGKSMSIITSNSQVFYRGR